MPLTILSVAYPFAAVGPAAVGGAEQVLTLIDQALVAAGHRSIVIGCEGSHIQGTLLTIPAVQGRVDEDVRKTAYAAVRARIREALCRYAIDIVHLHGVDCHRYLPEGEVPTLVTLHLDPGSYAEDLLRSPRPNLFLQCVSRTERRACAGARPVMMPTIENGVPLDQLWPSRRKKRFAVSLGRICPEKGFHLAIDAARRARIPLVLAGTVYPYPAHREYFNLQLVPRLREPGVRYLGAADRIRKRNLLAQARCLLIPSQIPETSSLVAMEAMACGTPVIAFGSGALPEIVENRQTGFIVNSVDSMAEAIQQVGSIDPATCRRVAEARFSAQRMTAQYVKLYESIATSKAVARRKASHMLEVEEVTTRQGLDALRTAWLALWRQMPNASIFQHPDWLISWCKPFDVHQPWVVVLRQKGGVVGVAPFLVYVRGNQRVLTLMGAGASDDQDVLLLPGYAAECMAKLWSFLDHARDRFDACELENLQPDSPLLDYPPRTRWHYRTCASGMVRPVLRLDNDARQLAQVASRGMAKEVRYRRGRAERDGLSVSIQTADVANLQVCLDQFVRLHRQRWSTRDQPGMLVGRLEAFHRDVARKFAEQGLLRLHLLYLAETAAAAFYGFATPRRTVFYLGGFDPRFEAYSPGTLVVAHAIERALRDGAAEFDFLRGGEAYKYRWGAVDRELYACELTPTQSEAETHRAA